jgi:hypothetical protein
MSQYIEALLPLDLSSRYDTSPNHYPGLFNGANAHWAVIVGSVEAIFPNDGGSEASTSKVPEGSSATSEHRHWVATFQGKST